MLNITENPQQTAPVLIPEADIFLFGRGKVNFSWNFTRKVPFWFLYYIAEPGARLDFGGRIVRPSGQEIILIPPNTPFCSACDSPFEHLYIHFTAGPPYSRVKPEVMIFDHSICGILDLLLNESSSSDAAVYAMLFSVLAAIPPEQFGVGGTPEDDRIRHAIMLMGKGVHREEICRTIGMSSSNFQRKFRDATGVSPHRYALQIAMEKARTMLSFGTESIGGIAAACGFADRYIFSKAFKKETGMPPAAYRSCRKKTEDSVPV